MLGVQAGTTTPGYLTRTGAKGFSPASVPGLGAWFDASNAASITQSGGLVSQWNDLSGNGRHVVQAAAGAKPTTGVKTINGLNAFGFDGDRKLIASGLSTPVVNTGTFIAVIRPSSTTSSERVLSFNVGANDFDNTGSFAAILRINALALFGSHYNSVSRGNVAVTNATHVVTTRRSGDAHECWADGVSGGAVAGLGTANFGFTSMWIGADPAASVGAGYHGEIAEALWYSTALSTADRQAIEAYLTAKWCPVPLQIAGIQAWYDASVGSRITSAGGLVSAWADGSGNGRDLSQGSDPAKPKIGNTVNGLPVLTFVTGSETISRGGVSIAQPLTMFAVVRRSETAAANRQVVGDNTDPEATLYTDTGAWALYATAPQVGSISSSDTLPHVLSAVFSAGASGLWVDAVVSTLPGNPGTAGRTEITVGFGAGQSLQGDIAEVILYSGALSAGDRQAIETYLKNKWLPVPRRVTGLQAWYDASDPATVFSSGGKATVWSDISGNGRFLSAAGVGSPTTGVATVNGLNALTFDGVANVMRCDGMTTPVVNTGTWIAVFRPRPPTTSSYDRVVSMGKAGMEDYGNVQTIDAIGRNNVVEQWYSYYNSAEIGGSGDVAVHNRVHVVTTQRNGDAYSRWVNGIAGTGATGLGTSNFAFTTMAVGDTPTGSTSHGYYTGDLCEVLWYSTALSATDRQMVENYLINKWAIPSVQTFNPLTAINWAAASWTGDPLWAKPANAAAVSSWLGSGTVGSGNLVQATGANQPTFESNAPRFGRRGAIVFDGVNDALEGTAFTAVGVPYTMVVVMSRDGSGGGGAERIMNVKHDAGASLLMDFPTSGRFGVYAGAGIADGPLDPNAHLLIGKTDLGANGYISRDGGAPVVGTTSLTQASQISIAYGSVPAEYGKVSVAFVGFYAGDFMADGKFTEFKQWVAYYYGLVIA